MENENGYQISFDNKYMYFNYAGIDYRVETEEASSKLANADNQYKMHFKLSPSGLGIYWPLMDEDLLFSGLLKIAKRIKTD